MTRTAIQSMLIFSLLLLLVPLSLAQTGQRSYRVLGADLKHIAIVDAQGRVEWEIPNPDAREVHDIQMLENGNILFQTSYTRIVEVSRDRQVVWSHDSKPKEGYDGRVEIHSYQRLRNGLTLIAESGNSRLIEVDRAGQIVKTIPLTVTKTNAHRDTRMVRRLENGHYLVCQEMEGSVREYDGTGRIVWEYRLDLAGRPRSPGHGVE
ncbi:MAG: hypothetical protein ACK562_08800, partial [Acidobacteriota bacterium]